MAWVRSDTSQLRYLLSSESSPVGCTIIPQRPMMSTNYDIGIGCICLYIYLLIDFLMLLTGLKLFYYRMIIIGVCNAVRIFARYSVLPNKEKVT